jgi:hypothetical protein
LPRSWIYRAALLGGLSAPLIGAAVANAADGRRWIADKDSQTAQLIYGTPESDDMLLSLTCEKKTKTLWVFFAPSPAPDKAPAKMPITLSSEAGKAELTATGTRSEMDDSYSLEAKTTMTPDIAKVLTGAKTISVSADNRKTDVPLDDVALGVIGDLVQGCQK